jgi:hypothetical protein
MTYGFCWAHLYLGKDYFPDQSKVWKEFRSWEWMKPEDAIIFLVMNA